MKNLWQAGAWFGSQIGGTTWILVASILTWVRSPMPGMMLLAMFIIPNTVGTLLWMRRERLSFHAALQMLMVTMCVFSLMTVFILDVTGYWFEIQVGSSIAAGPAYWLILLMFAALMWMFYFQFGRTKPNSEE